MSKTRAQLASDIATLLESASEITAAELRALLTSIVAASPNLADDGSVLKVVVNDQIGTEYTLLDSDIGKIVRLSNFDPIDLFIPPGLASGFHCIVIQGDSGAVNIQSGGGISVQSRDNRLVTNGGFARADICQAGTDIYNVSGDLVP